MPPILRWLLALLALTGVLLLVALAAPYVAPIRWKIGRAHLDAEWQMMVPYLPDYRTVPQGLSARSFRVYGWAGTQDQKHLYLRSGNLAWHAGWYDP